MTVNVADNTSGPYQGNDVADDFPYDFVIQDKSQLKVYEYDSADNVTLLSVDVDYTVNDVGNVNGGSITRNAGALPTGYEWYIVSDYKTTQLTEFESQGGFFPDVHEDAFDKLTYLAIQVQRALGKTIRIPDSEYTPVNLVLPNASGRANKFLGFGGNGEVEVFTTAAESVFNVITNVQVLGNGQTDVTFPEDIATYSSFYLRGKDVDSGRLSSSDYVVLSDNSIRLINSYPEGTELVAAYNESQTVSSPVASVFGRTGIVTAQLGDYDASQIDNDSNVSGTTVADALNVLPTTYKTLTGLKASTPDDETVLHCEELGNAKFIKQPSGYVALPGDVTLDNGGVLELQIDGSAHVGWFNVKADGGDETVEMQAALDRAPELHGDIDKIINSGTLSVTSNHYLKNLKFKLKDNTNLELLSTDRNASNVTYDNIIIDGNKANNTGFAYGIKVNGSVGVTIKSCDIKDTNSHGIGVFSGDINNTGLLIDQNTIDGTDGEGMQLRAVHETRVTGNTIKSWAAGENAIEFQEACSDVIVSKNVCKDTVGNLFAIESAGTPALVSNFAIVNNTFEGDYIGISGRFEKGVISNNSFKGGIGTWRSGIELAGQDLIVSDNSIDNGSIAIASHGSTVPVYNAKNILVTGNRIRNIGDNQKGIYLGAAASATGTPTSEDIIISDNIVDFSASTGTGTRGMHIGTYSLTSVLKNVNIFNNVLRGNAAIASARGILMQSAAGGTKVIVKSNTVDDFAVGVNLSDDSLSRFVLRNNDLTDSVSVPFSDTSTTTTVINVDNDV